MTNVLKNTSIIQLELRKAKRKAKYLSSDIVIVAKVGEYHVKL